MNKINFLYIDDIIDPHVTGYMNSISINDVSFDVNQYKFIPKTDDYRTLLKNQQVLDADLIIIDSMLFENNNVGEVKIAGEEMQLIFQKIFPYKEVLVISQKGKDEKKGIISKLQTNKVSDYHQFFEEEWKPIIENLVNKIIVTRNIFKQFKLNDNIESVLKEKIQNTIETISKYEDLEKSDIDKCISLFNEIKDTINEKGL